MTPLSRGVVAPAHTGRMVPGPLIVDIKPRSRDVTDGLEKAAARGMLRAVGMGDDDFAKPQIGVASSWNEITPCNLSLDRLAKSAKEGVRAAGGYPAGVRHHLGLRRHLDGPRGHALLAGLARGHRRLGRDGDAGRAARRLGPAGRLRQVAARDADGRRAAGPGVGVPLRGLDPARGGQESDGSERDVTIIDAFEAVGACCARPDHPRRASTRSSGRSAPARAPAAACTPPTRWPAPPRRSGMSLPGSAAPPATDRRRDGYARRIGRGRRRAAATRHHRPPDPDQGGVRERDHGGDGARRLDQRGAAPAGHRPRGRGRADARRLQPDR